MADPVNAADEDVWTIDIAFVGCDEAKADAIQDEIEAVLCGTDEHHGDEPCPSGLSWVMTLKPLSFTERPVALQIKKRDEIDG